VIGLKCLPTWPPRQTTTPTSAGTSAVVGSIRSAGDDTFSLNGATAEFGHIGKDCSVGGFVGSVNRDAVPFQHAEGRHPLRHAVNRNAAVPAFAGRPDPDPIRVGNGIRATY
jgi:hypothetical protein